MSDTWKFVPVEPTEQMIEAGRHVKRMRLLDSVKAIREGRDPEELMGKTAGAEYRAMLDAAPAPPVPSSVQDIMRLMMPYVDACAEFENETIPRLRRISEDEVAATFAPLQSALIALVDDNHRLKFELDGVNAMRGPLTDERILAGVKEFADENYFANYQDDILRCVRSLFGHGIEPEQGGNHGNS